MSKEISFTQKCWIEQLDCKSSLDRKKHQKQNLLKDIKNCEDNIDRVLFNIYLTDSDKQKIIKERLENYHSFKKCLHEIERNIHIYYSIIIDYDVMIKYGYMDIF